MITNEKTIIIRKRNHHPESQALLSSQIDQSLLDLCDKDDLEVTLREYDFYFTNGNRQCLDK